MTNLIQEKVWNIELVVEEIKQAPQTYETILKSESKNGTLMTILRRKLSKLVKDGIICRTTIPSTRYSRVIYYCIPKAYYILFESSRFGCEVFYFRKYAKRQKFYIFVDVCYHLIHDKWEEEYNKKVFEGGVLKLI